MSVLAPTKAYQQGLDCPLFAPLRPENQVFASDTSAETKKPTAKEMAMMNAQLAADAAGTLWTEAAYSLAASLIEKHGWLIAEHVWVALRERGMDTGHPTAMGAVLARLGRNGIAVNTGLTKATNVERSHGRPQAIWARPGVMLMQVMNWAGLQ